MTFFIFREGAAPRKFAKPKVPKDGKLFNECTLIFISTFLNQKVPVWTS